MRVHGSIGQTDDEDVREIRFAIVLILLAAPVAGAATFTVNVNDSAFDGCTSAHCNFYEAVFAAQQTAGHNTVAFAFPTTPQTIIVSQIPLGPHIIVDGTTQPGYAGTPLIELRGGVLLQGGNASTNTTIRALLIRNAAGDTRPVIDVDGYRGSLVLESNYIGTTITGNGDGGSHSAGIEIQPSSQASIRIGGPGAQRNVIGGGDYGIRIDAVTAGSITIEGNHIGIGADGSTPVPNQNGIYSTDNLAPLTIRDNIIASNTRNGIQLWSGKRQTIEGNFIGVLPDGTLRGNAQNGVYVGGSDGSGAATTIGGTSPSQRNVISGNGAAGIVLGLGGEPLTNVTVHGNSIGVAPNGVTARGNGEAGIQVIDPNTVGILTEVVVGVAIGGRNAGEGNLIAFNGGAGVNLRDGASGNPIEGNSIHSNGGLAIDLSSVYTTGLGPTPNDSADADVGLGNNGQNFPVLTSATTDGATLTVNGTLSSTPSRNYRICLYANSAVDPSGYGEAETFLGCTTALTNASWNATFTMTTSAPAPGAWVAATATDLVTNDTSELSLTVPVLAPGILQFNTTAYSVAEGAGNAVVQINRTNGSDGTVSVTLATANGSAVAGSDYTATTTAVTLADGEATKSVTLPIVPDSVDEAAETFTVTLSNPTGSAALGATIQSLVTIHDDDPAPSLSIGDTSVGEGTGGSSVAVFTVIRSGETSKSITVQYATGDVTASAPADYAAASGTLTFAPDEATKTIAVTVAGDGVAESDETFTVTLSSASHANLADTQGVGTILDDDTVPSISIGDASVSEGSNATFAVTLSHASSQTVTVDYATAATSGTITFAPHVTTQTISVATTQDLVDEPDEPFQVTLSNPVNATLSDPVGDGTIVDDDGTPQLTIGDSAAVESASTVSFAVSLSNPSSSDVSVTWATADATARAGGDYTAQAAQALIIPAFSTAATITVPLLGDTAAEANETFVVNLTAPSGNATLADGQAIATIVDDDGTPQLTISDAASVEGDTAVFAVTLSHVSSSPIVVAFSTSDGTAHSPADYTATAGNLNFAPGQISQTVSVVLAGDSLIETAERFTVTLSSPSNATIADGEGRGTIIDDDGMPALSAGDVSAIEGSTATFTVSLSAPTSAAVSVGYATANGTASDADYTAAAGTLEFAPGVTARTITVSVTSDTLIESAETFSLNLSSPTNATLANPSALGTITDDDGTATLTIGDVTATEGANATFTVSLSGTTSQPVTVRFETGDATAVAGSDYVRLDGTLTFPSGPASQTITIEGIADTLVEGTETFNVILRDASGATISDPSALATILDDDTMPAPIPALFVSDATVTEGNSGTTPATFMVSLSTTTSSTVSVGFATADASASTADYASTTGTLVFAPGTLSQTIAVAVNGDTLVEGNETFTLLLQGPVHAALADAEALGTIIDDDSSPAPIPAISIRNAAVAEGNSGTATASFEVVLSASSVVPVSVGYNSSNGTATAGSDYAAVSGTLTFPAGTTTRSIAVTVTGDMLVEASETFTVILSNASNATIATANATGTIVNDDAESAPPPPPPPARDPRVSLDPSVRVTECTGGIADEALFTVRVTPRPDDRIVVEYATTAGSASAGADFETTSKTLFIKKGQSTATIAVPVRCDTEDEPEETFLLTLNEASGGEIRGPVAVATIVDDDVAVGRTRAIATVIGATAGAQGSMFRTALRLFNSTDRPVRGLIVVHPAGRAAAESDPSVPYALHAGESRLYADVMHDAGLEGLASADLVALEGTVPTAFIRVFNDGGGSGSTGFASQELVPADALHTGDTAALFVPSDLQMFRFNAGVRSLDGGATFDIEVLDAAGQLRSRTSRTIPPNFFVQTSGSDFAGTSLGGGETIRLTVRAGQLIAYGAAIDNVTNDPSVQFARKGN